MFDDDEKEFESVRTIYVENDNPITVNAPNVTPRNYYLHLSDFVEFDDDEKVGYPTHITEEPTNQTGQWSAAQWALYDEYMRAVTGFPDFTPSRFFLSNEEEESESSSSQLLELPNEEEVSEVSGLTESQSLLRRSRPWIESSEWSEISEY